MVILQFLVAGCGVISFVGDKDEDVCNLLVLVILLFFTHGKLNLF